MKNIVLAVLVGFVFSRTTFAEVTITVFDGEEAYKNRPAAANPGESAIHFFQGGKEVSAAVEGEPVRAVRWFTIPDRYNQKGELLGVFRLFRGEQIMVCLLTLDKEPGHPTVKLELAFTPNAGNHILSFVSLCDNTKDSRPLIVNPKKTK